MKKIILALAITAAFTAPAFAEEAIKCDDATISAIKSKMDAAGSKLKDKADVAIGHINNAQEAMKAGKTDDCVKELTAAADIANHAQD